MNQSKISLVLGLFFLLSSLTLPHQAQADIDPKVKTVATMAAYGTVGGALLGTASLAFGTEGRSVAIGSSVGLYLGLIFGSYIIVTHSMQQKGYFREDGPVNRDYYPDDSYSPYGGGQRSSGQNDSGFFRVQSLHDLEMSSLHDRRELDRMGGIAVDRPSFEINLLRLQF